MTQALLLENPLWQFSLAVYQYAPLQRQLLTMQNELGANVNVLLCQGWLSHQNRQLPERHWQTLGIQLQPWQIITEQLRHDRITLKPAAEIVPPAAQLRRQVKRWELLSEQYQLALMYQYCQVAGVRGAQSWREFLAFWGWGEGLERLPDEFAKAYRLLDQ